MEKTLHSFGLSNLFTEFLIKHKGIILGELVLQTFNKSKNKTNELWIYFENKKIFTQEFFSFFSNHSLLFSILNKNYEYKFNNKIIHVYTHNIPVLNLLPVHIPNFIWYSNSYLMIFNKKTIKLIEYV